MVALLLAPAGLTAQDSLRGWGGVRFDTGIYTLPITFVAATGSSTAVLRNDGKSFVHGSTTLPDAPAAPAGTSYVQVGITVRYPTPIGFALCSDGTIVSWSASGPGLPAPALPANTTYTKLVVGYEHALAVRSDGVAVAWGGNVVGQATVPNMPVGITVADAHAGGYWSLLLLSNGSIVAFGSNNQGQQAVPTLPTGTTYTAIWGGPFHAIARRSDGALVAWGANDSGQCNVPALPTGVTYANFALGESHTIGLRSDGTLVGWGENSYGQTNVPQLPVGVPCVQLAAGQFHSLARLANGAVIGWPSSYAGPIPTLQAGEHWTSCSAGSEALGLTSAGRAVSVLDKPVPVPPPGYTYTEVIAGDLHNVALRSDGRAIAWGSNANGQGAIPPLPPGMTYTSGSLGWNLTTLLRSDGAAIRCGSGSGGGAIPPLPLGLRYEEVSCHEQGTLLRRSDGAVLVLGGSGNNATNPPTLPAGVSYVAVARARYFNAALRSDGQIELWGSNFAAPLPPLPNGVVYVAIDTGEDSMIARRSDGLVVAAAPTIYDALLAVPTPAPGESFVEASAGRALGVVRVGPTCTYVTFANGCAGSRAASRLVPRDTPRLGRFLQVTVFDLPLDAAVMVFGWNRTAPIPLLAFGLPGCFQHVTADASFLITGQQGNARYHLGIPNDLALLGLQFRNQAVGLDPLANAAGAVVSDAAEGVIGRW